MVTSPGLDCVIRLPTSSSEPIPVAAPSKAWVCGCRFLGLRVRIPPTAWRCVCCKCRVLSGRGLYVGWSLVKRSPTECGVSECDREASVLGRPWHTRGCCAGGGGGQISPKHWYPYTNSNCVTSQRALILTFTALEQFKSCAFPSLWWQETKLASEISNFLLV
jgi:hypothetical protein